MVKIVQYAVLALLVFVISEYTLVPVGEALGGVFIKLSDSIPKSPSQWAHGY
jgi:hypothetical protein